MFSHNAMFLSDVFILSSLENRPGHGGQHLFRLVLKDLEFSERLNVIRIFSSQPQAPTHLKRLEESRMLIVVTG